MKPCELNVFDSAVVRDAPTRGRSPPKDRLARTSLPSVPKRSCSAPSVSEAPQRSFAHSFTGMPTDPTHGSSDFVTSPKLIEFIRSEQTTWCARMDDRVRSLEEAIKRHLESELQRMRESIAQLCEDVSSNTFAEMHDQMQLLAHGVQQLCGEKGRQSEVDDLKKALAAQREAMGDFQNQLLKATTRDQNSDGGCVGSSVKLVDVTAAIEAALGTKRAEMGARGELPSQLRQEFSDRLDEIDRLIHHEITLRASSVAACKDDFDTRVQTLDTDLRCELALRVAFVEELPPRVAIVEKRLNALEKIMAQIDSSLASLTSSSPSPHRMGFAPKGSPLASKELSIQTKSAGLSVSPTRRQASTPPPRIDSLFDSASPDECDVKVRTVLDTEDMKTLRSSTSAFGLSSQIEIEPDIAPSQSRQLHTLIEPALPQQVAFLAPSQTILTPGQEQIPQSAFWVPSALKSLAPAGRSSNPGCARGEKVAPQFLQTSVQQAYNAAQAKAGTLQSRSSVPPPTSGSQGPSSPPSLLSRGQESSAPISEHVSPRTTFRDARQQQLFARAASVGLTARFPHPHRT